MDARCNAKGHCGLWRIHPREYGLERPAACRYGENGDGVRANDEGYGGAAFEADDAEARTDVVAAPAPLWEGLQAAAGSLDALDVCNGAFGAAALGDVGLEIAKVCLCPGAKDDFMAHAAFQPSVPRDVRAERQRRLPSGWRWMGLLA